MHNDTSSDTGSTYETCQEYSACTMDASMGKAKGLWDIYKGSLCVLLLLWLLPLLAA